MGEESSFKEYQYQVPTGDEAGNFLGMKEKTVIVNDNLLETIVNTEPNFFRAFPLELIEKFLVQYEERLDMKTLKACVNNLHLHVLRGELGDSASSNIHKNMEYYEGADPDEKLSVLISHSKKRLHQTPFEVDETCKKAAAESGLSLVGLVQEFKNSGISANFPVNIQEKSYTKDRDQLAKNFLLKMVKIYLLLRKQGYTHLDITQ